MQLVSLCLKHESGDVMWCRALLHSVWRYSHQMEHMGQSDVSFPFLSSVPIPQHPIPLLHEKWACSHNIQNLSSLKQLYADNFMMGYRMVFDRDNLKLGWSLSDCELFPRSFFSHLTSKCDCPFLSLIAQVQLVPWLFTMEV